MVHAERDKPRAIRRTLEHPVALVALMAVLVGMFLALPNERYRWSDARRLVGGSSGRGNPSWIQVAVYANSVTGELRIEFPDELPATGPEWTLKESDSVRIYEYERGMWGITHRVITPVWREQGAPLVARHDEIADALKREGQWWARHWSDDHWLALSSNTSVVRRRGSGYAYNAATVIVGALTGVSIWLTAKACMVRARRHAGEGLCPACGYSRVGLEGAGCCPECGAALM